MLDDRDVRVDGAGGPGAGDRDGGGGGGGFVAVKAALEVATAAMEVAAAAMETTTAVTGYAGGGAFSSGGWRPTGSGLARPLAVTSCYTCANAGLTRQCP